MQVIPSYKRKKRLLLSPHHPSVFELSGVRFAEAPRPPWKVTPNSSCGFSGVSSRLLILFAFFTAIACSKLLLSAQASAAPLPGPFGSRLDTILFSPSLAAKPSQIPLTYASGGLQTIITIVLLYRRICKCLGFFTTRNFSLAMTLH